VPKVIDYPHASLAKSTELAKAVYDLGGSCGLEMCAEQMGKKVGGGFKAIVSSSSKYGLITNNRGQLETTDLFRDYHLSYTSEEKAQILRTAFLRVPLFKDIYERFKQQQLPVGIFDKLLIREFDVNQQVASRVAKYFVEGAKATGLLKGDNTFAPMDGEEIEDEDLLDDEDGGDAGSDSTSSTRADSEVPLPSHDHGEFSVRIIGPGMNSTIAILEEEDLDIVEVMLKKVRKKLSEAQKE